MSTFPSHRVYILQDSLLYIYTAKKRPLKLCGFSMGSWEFDASHSCSPAFIVNGPLQYVLSSCAVPIISIRNIALQNLFTESQLSTICNGFKRWNLWEALNCCKVLVYLCTRRVVELIKCHGAISSIACTVYHLFPSRITTFYYKEFKETPRQVC